MSLRKFRWSKVYESSEEELTDFLQARNIAATEFSAEAFDTSESQSSNKETTIWCAEGSLTFHSTDATVSLQPGDALHIPDGATYTLVAGISGYLCYHS